MLFDDTIFALSSGRPPAGLAVIRLSGRGTLPVLKALGGRDAPPRQAVVASFRSADGQVIDRGMMIFFQGPHSFTGEDCGEFHLHGGRAVVSAMLEELTGISGLRPAEAGEFSRRAFQNGKIDLVEAEALADLVAAETEAQRRFALTATGGALSGLYADWRRRVLDARSGIEAQLDFSDDADVPDNVAEAIWSDLSALAEEIGAHVDGFHRAEIIREGFSVVIVGPPNAGKSSLLNALAKRDVAIVTDEPGTTRDLISVALDLEGMKVVLTDTAGLREAAGHVESIGIERARQSAGEADLVLRVDDVRDPHATPLIEAAGVVRVGNKSDLLPGGPAPECFDLLVSARTGAGLEALIDLVCERAGRSSGGSSSLLPTRVRHVALLNLARNHLVQALAGDLELRAEALRLASDALGKIVGVIDVEEVLGAIFSQFCIGK